MAVPPSGPSSVFQSSVLEPGAERPGSALESALRGLQPLPRWMGWRFKALVVLVLLSCLGLFGMAHFMAQQARLPFELQATPNGQLRIQSVDYPPLQHLEGRVLVGIGVVGPPNLQAPLNAATLQRSARWLPASAQRESLIHAHDRVHLVVSAALASDRAVLLHFQDHPDETVVVAPQGWRGLTPLFWLLALMALGAYVVSVVVAMSDLRWRNLAFALMTLSQSVQLGLLAIGSAWGWMSPSWMLQWDLDLRITFDLVCTAAMLHLAVTYPRDLPHGPKLALGAWALAALTWLWAHGQHSDAQWWVVHAVCLGLSGAAVLAFGIAFQRTQHPVCLVVRRFVAVGALSWTLLVGVLAFGHDRPDMRLQVSLYGVMVWHLYAGLTASLSPYLSRTRPILLEFSMLAASSTVAASLDLLFVAVFSLGQFTSMTLSLFLSFGVYLIVRRWLLNRLPGRDPLTMERLFQRLYRIAREVERRPDSLDASLLRLMREMFDPLEVQLLPGELRHASLRGNGSVLLVPVPQAQADSGHVRPAPSMLMLKHAAKGQRLFTSEDARLAERVMEQLHRALSFDQAVEQGRSEERLRIAQDLHDDIGARLLTLMYQAPNPEIEEYIRHTIQDLKTLTRGLAAQSHGLAEAAGEWKRDLNQRMSAARCELDWQMSLDDEVTLTMVQWSALTRILRELVSNALSHARATRVKVQLVLAHDRLSLTVEDNGLGREPASWSHGLGLGGVRKRVKQLGGSVRWLEAEPKGIRCEVVVEPFSTSAQPTATQQSSQQGQGTHPGLGSGAQVSH
jgi:signal transduction histidine kinase